MQKRKHDDQERDNRSSIPRGKILRNDQYQAAEKSPSSSNDVQVTVSKLAMQPVPCSANKVESSNDLDAAKVAAVKAAELVNRNIVGSGYMSTNQKKKLLWGNRRPLLQWSLVATGVVCHCFRTESGRRNSTSSW